MQTHWIDHQAVASDSPAIPVINPANETEVDTIPQGDAQDADRAVKAARRAFAGWSQWAPAQRREALKLAAGKIESHCEAISKLLTIEMGKTLVQSRGEVMGAADVMRQMGDFSLHLRAGSQMTRLGEVNFQQRCARGVAASIVPWNYPVMVGVENVAANLAVGNTVVWKPSEKTPLSSRMIAQLAFDHLPAGVVNVLLGHGPGAGDALVRHPGVDIVVFVGSERTGRALGALCGQHLKKIVLELGGKDPLVIDETVDIEKAAAFAALSTYTNAGQICTSTERIYVARSRFDEFVDRLAAHSAGLRVGDGLLAETQMGPIVDATQVQTIAAQVSDAIARGAQVHAGGERLSRQGYFFPPTVLTSVSKDSVLMNEETFGPVAPCFAFDDFDEALAMANDSRYGLSAIVCTTSAPRALQAVHQLNTGMLRINTMRGRSAGATSEPFGASGLGHGYGLEFLYELTRQKSVYWRAELE
jgi:acyl-CoA reductase-like NAD-dependent aldehyde dehydrogenase